MKRRSFVQGAAATALGVPPLAGLAQQSVTLKFHTFMAPMSNVWLSMHKPWMEKVEKDSGGRIKFEAYPAMQLGGTPPQLFDQAKDGVADIVWTLPGYQAGRFLATEVFELPFMVASAYDLTPAEATAEKIEADLLRQNDAMIKLNFDKLQKIEQILLIKRHGGRAEDNVPDRQLCAKPEPNLANLELACMLFKRVQDIGNFYRSSLMQLA